MIREFYAQYVSGYVVFVTYDELWKLFKRKRKPVRCGRVVYSEGM